MDVGGVLVGLVEVDEVLGVIVDDDVDLAGSAGDGDSLAALLTDKNTVYGAYDSEEGGEAYTSSVTRS